MSIFISQQKYIYDLLKNANRLICKPTSASINYNHKSWITKKYTID